MKNKRFLILRTLAMAMLVLFTFSSCATVTSNYQSKDSRLVTIEHAKDGKVYKRDGETFKPHFYNQGLVEAVSPNPEAKGYAEQGVKKLKLSYGLSFGALAVGLASLPVLFIGDSKKNNTMIGISLGMLVGALGLAIPALIPQKHSETLFQNAINKYNDDVLNKNELK